MQPLNRHCLTMFWCDLQDVEHNCSATAHAASELAGPLLGCEDAPQ